MTSFYHFLFRVMDILSLVRMYENALVFFYPSVFLPVPSFFFLFFFFLVIEIPKQTPASVLQGAVLYCYCKRAVFTMVASPGLDKACNNIIITLLNFQEYIRISVCPHCPSCWMRDHGRPFDRIGSDNCKANKWLFFAVNKEQIVARDEIYNVVVSGKQVHMLQAFLFMVLFLDPC